MEWTTRSMTEKHAVEILSWKYGKPYDFYNNVLSGDALLEMTNGSYHVILAGNHHIIGFYCTGKSAQVPAGDLVHAYRENCLDIGLGMRPDLTGKGLGTDFFYFVLAEIQQCYKGGIRLTVAEFNRRAIRLYEKFHFVKQGEFLKGDTKFITMKMENEVGV
jgi:[ribosomal protein S18]-alanine N-acetyltransferase